MRRTRPQLSASADFVTQAATGPTQCMPYQIHPANVQELFSTPYLSFSLCLVRLSINITYFIRFVVNLSCVWFDLVLPLYSIFSQFSLRRGWCGESIVGLHH
jgi:hypothetical protein